MLEYANIEDPNGEALANIVERESRRVLAELFNLPIPTNPADEVKKALAPFLTSDSGKPIPVTPKPKNKRQRGRGKNY